VSGEEAASLAGRMVDWMVGANWQFAGLGSYLWSQPWLWR
jgi:hypothetical protein